MVEVHAQNLASISTFFIVKDRVDGASERFLAETQPKYIQPRSSIAAIILDRRAGMYRARAPCIIATGR
jgi:hypothetical protein